MALRALLCHRLTIRCLAVLAALCLAGSLFADPYDIFTVGAGHLDINAALNNTDSTSDAALSPTVFYNSQLQLAIRVNPPGSTWNNTTWSLTNVWGFQVIQPMSGTSAAWGRRRLGEPL